MQEIIKVSYEIKKLAEDFVKTGKRPSGVTLTVQVEKAFQEARVELLANKEADLYMEIWSEFISATSKVTFEQMQNHEAVFKHLLFVKKEIKEMTDDRTTLLHSETSGSRGWELELAIRLLIQSGSAAVQTVGRRMTPDAYRSVLDRLKVEIKQAVYDAFGDNKYQLFKINQGDNAGEMREFLKMMEKVNASVADPNPDLTA